MTLGALLLGAGLAAPDPAVSKTEPALPNLFAYPPSWFVGPVSGAMPYRDPTSPARLVDGCRLEERAEGAERCLRFQTRIVNFDLAPLRLALRAEPSGTNVYQVVEGDARPAGTFSVDLGRAEVQLDDFYLVRMWRFDGRRKVGRPVASTGLRGFCPGLGAVYGWRQTCPANLEEGPGGWGPTVVLPWLWFVTYTPDVVDQYIEISGVRNGLYVLEIEIDPKDHIRESYERDNRTCNVIRLRGNMVYELRNDYCWRRRT